MSTLLAAGFGLALRGSAAASPPPAPVIPAGPSEPEAAAAFEAVRAELQAARAAAAADARTRALLEDALRALDPAVPTPARVEALTRAVPADPARAAALLRAALDGPTDALHIAALDLLPGLPGETPVEIAAAVALAPRYTAAVRAAAVDALARVQRPAAATALLRIIDTRAADRDVRLAASRALARAYPGRVAESAPLSSPLGAAAFVGAGALGGGTVFSSIGVWGRSDLGVGLGAVGGGLIGAGASALSLPARPQTAAGGLAHLSGTAWGLALSETAGRALWPAADDWPPDEAQRGARAALRSVGVSVGYIGGLVDGGRAASAADVVEANALAGIGCWGGAALGQRVAHWSGGYIGDDPGRHQSVFGGLGCGLGLAGGQWSRGTLRPGPADAGAVALLAVEGAILGAGIEAALPVDGASGGLPPGPPRAGLAGMVGASAAALGAWGTHRRPVTPAELQLATVGAVYGNVFALSLPIVIAPELDYYGLLASSAGGLAGMVGGAWSARALAPSGGDWLAVGLASAFTGVEAGALTAELADAGVPGAGLRVGAVGGLAGSLAGVGALAASRAGDLPAADVLLLTSAWGWGNALGATAPVMFDGDVSRGRAVGALSATALGGVLVSPLVGLDPARTVRPQLGGIAGATTAALVSTLFTDDRAVIAGAGVGGAVAGLGAGALWEGARGGPPSRAGAAARPVGDRRGSAALQWGGSLTPVGPGGAPGISASVHCGGW